jgi:hypothetical protein
LLAKCISRNFNDLLDAPEENDIAAVNLWIEKEKNIVKMTLDDAIKIPDLERRNRRFCGIVMVFEKKPLREQFSSC